jgi:hypothetical protein
MRHDLLKLKGAFVTNIQGREKTKRCICIPLDDSGLVVGQKGVYLNSVAIEMHNPKYEQTHLIKVDYPKEQREAMTDEERNEQPILGGLRPIQPKEPEGMEVTGNILAPPEDCPF